MSLVPQKSLRHSVQPIWPICRCFILCLGNILALICHSNQLPHGYGGWLGEVTLKWAGFSFLFWVGEWWGEVFLLLNQAAQVAAGTPGDLSGFF